MLQSSPPISIADVYAEFLCPAGTPIRDLFRGGPWVPNIPQNGNVPTSGEISLLHFLGATRYAPFTVGVSGSGGYVFQNEPAPTQRSVSGSLTATASGGTGNFTYSWAYVSGGPPGFTWSTASGGRVVNCTANVSKNNVVNVVFQLTVSDGVTTYQQNHTRSLQYETDI